MAEDATLLEGDPTAARLDRAVDNLEDALEAVDFERDPALADAVMEALSAADRARRRASG